MNWPVKRLGDVAQIVSGATPSTSVKEYWGEDHYWATPKDLSDLDNSIIEKTNRKLSDLGLVNCAAQLLPPNSVLFTSRAPIGLVAINNVPMATNQGFKSFIPNERLLDSKYLYHWLLFNRGKIDSMGVGATFKEVSKAIVSKIEIPVPPLVEQKRIAAMLDTADKVMWLREQAINKLDQLVRSVFQRYFGAENNVCRLSELFGVNENRFDYELDDNDEVDFIPMASVSEKSKKIEVIQKRLYGEVKKGYTPIKQGDVIVAKITPCYENGKMAVANNINKVAFGSTEFHTFRNSDERYSLFLYHFLKQDSVKVVGEKNMKGAAGQRRVPAGFFSSLMIPKPKIEDLQNFFDFAKEIEMQKERYSNSNNRSGELFASLQHQLLAVK